LGSIELFDPPTLMAMWARPNPGRWNRRVWIGGSGFQAGEAVALTIEGVYPLGRARADACGQFAYRTSFRPPFLSGVNWIVGIGLVSLRQASLHAMVVR
jgi:hypothetical protein